MPKPPQQLKVLQPWHEEALRLYFMGFKYRHITKATGHSQSSLSYLFASEAGRTYIAKLRDQTLATLQETTTELQMMLPRAVEEMRRLINSEWPELRFKAARFILESQGFTPVRRVEIKRVKAGSEDDWGKMGEAELREAAIAALTVETTTVPAIEEKHDDSGKNPLTMASGTAPEEERTDDTIGRQ